jgi:hypothetical protein
VPDLASLAAEFGLGQLMDTAPVPGHPDVVTITTGHGVFFVRPADLAAAELYEQVAHRPNSPG